MNQKLKRQNFNSNINNKNSKDHRPENNYNRKKDISKSQNILKLSSNQGTYTGPVRKVPRAELYSSGYCTPTKICRRPEACQFPPIEQPARWHEG